MELLKTWWKARKVFIFPKIQFYTCRHYKWFDFTCRDVQWKWKWDYVCFEHDPKFSITLFTREFGFFLTYPYTSLENNDFYWESILNYLYLCKKDLKETIIYSGYATRLPTGERYPVMSINYLKKKHHEFYKQIISSDQLEKSAECSS